MWFFPCQAAALGGCRSELWGTGKHHLTIWHSARFCFGTYLLYRSHYTAGMHQRIYLFLWDWEFCIQHPSRISFRHWKNFSPRCDEKSAALLQTLNPGWQKLKLKELKKQNKPWSMELHLFTTLHYLIRLSPGRQITYYAVRFIIL